MAKRDQSVAVPLSQMMALLCLFGGPFAAAAQPLDKALAKPDEKTKSSGDVPTIIDFRAS